MPHKPIDEYAELVARKLRFRSGAVKRSDYEQEAKNLAAEHMQTQDLFSAAECA